jgi:hypothetical protein
MKRFSKDRFADLEVPLGNRHQGHELGLQVGREAGKRLGRNVDRVQSRTVAAMRIPSLGLADLAPAAATASSAARSRSGLAPCRSTSPPVAAAPAMA